MGRQNLGTRPAHAARWLKVILRKLAGTQGGEPSILEFHIAFGLLQPGGDLQEPAGLQAHRRGSLPSVAHVER